MNEKEKAEDSISRKFGRLTVIAIEKDKRHRAIAVCECECGNRCKVQLANIKKPVIGTKSCGCLAKENRERQKKEFSAMLASARVSREKRKSYLRYDEYDDFGEQNVNLGWKV
jgi:hypothetical protein